MHGIQLQHLPASGTDWRGYGKVTATNTTQRSQRPATPDLRSDSLIEMREIFNASKSLVNSAKKTVTYSDVFTLH